MTFSPVGIFVGLVVAIAGGSWSWILVFAATQDTKVKKSTKVIIGILIILVWFFCAAFEVSQKF